MWLQKELPVYYDEDFRKLMRVSLHTELHMLNDAGGSKYGLTLTLFPWWDQDFQVSVVEHFGVCKEIHNKIHMKVTWEFRHLSH